MAQFNFIELLNEIKRVGSEVIFDFLCTFARKIRHMKMTFKAALFDLDGVVFNTEPQYSEFWKRQFFEFYLQSTNLADEIKGQTLIQIYDKYFNGTLFSKRKIITDRLNAFEKQMKFEYVIGIEGFISELHNNNVDTAIVTSSNKDKMESVYNAHPEIKQLFDRILTAENFERSKPDPDCYIKASQQFKCTNKECIVFEDSFNGLKSGRAAHMKVVGLATTNTVKDIQPYSDVVINNYLEIDYNKCLELLNSTL